MGGSALDPEIHTFDEWYANLKQGLNVADLQRLGRNAIAWSRHADTSDVMNRCMK
jgi:hypothetical protein